MEKKRDYLQVLFKYNNLKGLDPRISTKTVEATKLKINVMEETSQSQPASTCDIPTCQVLCQG